MSQDFIHLPAELIGQITQVLAVSINHHAMLSVDLADNPEARKPHDQLARGCKALLEQIRDALATPAPEPVIGLYEGDLFAQGLSGHPRAAPPFLDTLAAVLQEFNELTPVRILRARYLPVIYGVLHAGTAHHFKTEAEAAAFCASLQPPAEPDLTNAPDPTPPPSGGTPAVAEA